MAYKAVTLEDGSIQQMGFGSTMIFPDRTLPTLDVGQLPTGVRFYGSNHMSQATTVKCYWHGFGTDSHVGCTVNVPAATTFWWVF